MKVPIFESEEQVRAYAKRLAREYDVGAGSWCYVVTVQPEYEPATALRVANSRRAAARIVREFRVEHRDMLRAGYAKIVVERTKLER